MAGISFVLSLNRLFPRILVAHGAVLELLANDLHLLETVL